MTKSPNLGKKFVFTLLRTATNMFSGKGFRLGKVPGAMKVHTILFNRLLPVEAVLVRVQGSMMYVSPQDSGVGVNLLRSRVHEPNETRLFKQAMKEGMVVVDVGAHIGYYTLIASKLIGAKGRVYAFEPDPSNYRLLVRNIHENQYKNVLATQKAVGNKEQKIALFLNKKDFGSHSLSRSNVPELENSMEVESTTLDRFFEKNVGNYKVDFVKMDAQGAEGLIIEGMSKILQKNHDVKMVMEFWQSGLANMSTEPKQLLVKLKNYGFKFQRVNEKTRSLEETDINQLLKQPAGIGVNLWLEKSR